MSLIKSRQLFGETEFPVMVDTVVDRAVLQKNLHRHEYFEMLFVEKGSLINRFKGAEIQMKTGDVLIMKPYVPHVLEDVWRKQPGKAYCCSFLPQAVDSNIRSLEELKISSSPNGYFFKPFMPLVEEGVSAVQIKLHSRQCGVLAGSFEQLRRTTHEHTQRGNALTRCRFLDLLEFLASHFEQGRVRSQTVQGDLATPVSRCQAGMHKALNYIHDHFQEPLLLEDMAAMSGASRTYFCRFFRHETGATFLNYLNGLRIEHACVLLRDTAASALDICYQVGFNDYTHFGRQFKKNTGLAPAEFRKQKSTSPPQSE